MELARQKLAAADLVVLVFDRNRPWSEAGQGLADLWRGALLVHNKSDLPASANAHPLRLLFTALRQEGIEEFAAAIADRLLPDLPPPGAAVPFTEEQAERIRAYRRV
jgi:tRNA modification GTPase